MPEVTSDMSSESFSHQVDELSSKLASTQGAQKETTKRAAWLASLFESPSAVERSQGHGAHERRPGSFTAGTVCAMPLGESSQKP